ncbi:amino acid deaminase [Mesorhizobium sp. M4A.F.Ca.ET.020.02.1.1]|uniref:alanine racemase n=1 Tax=unclassified Mesorhizobium TaxID=325217 RepID=UPI000FCCAC21|nr:MULTISPECIES: alanine racemase [unclassified Mesorhizobium]RVD70363.1 amino acid deaminase [Mesorhizobium sp. M4A.F.Ca.ET.029.04.2.1]RUX48867.1 amino acid deaminase [Mesorhizobium sp. M4A.F.Ca.ET.050.02.1.1]RVD34644.1 amino acid deaminase [Mesorhizobium sp. M4A.F.Ca.ET.020.02.1.1]RWC19727.1 MAG: amino acid deaminase [Mesorhizobium sp.]TIW36476.1 MAG: amino acid deaminase [Mesorhizobium sp.]
MSENTPAPPLVVHENFLLDDRIRGVPPGTSGLDSRQVGQQGWHPADGRMSLPLLTLDEAAFTSNRDLFLRYIREQGAEIAPHAKTPMAPDLARSLVEAGAWGTTVADIRQATVMLKTGLTRLIIANEVGGAGGAGRLAALAGAWPDAELSIFADSVPAVGALAQAWRANSALQPLPVLVELGTARAGARSTAEAEAIADAIAATGGRLLIAGVATYEGAAAQSDPVRADEVVSALLANVGDMFLRLRARVGGEAPLIATAGGSVFFDKVVAALSHIVAKDSNARLVLRSGAIFFHDHGVYDRSLGAVDARNGFTVNGASVSARRLFRPALRIWAEVLSRPEPSLAICGMGMRDVSFDQGFPKPLMVHRAGHALAVPPKAEVIKLNDQHAFLSLQPGDDIAVGDVVEFGISHPCTCLDRYRVIFGVDGNGHVAHAFPTYFG